MKKDSTVAHLLQLSRKELEILGILEENDTPASLAKKCSIPRPTIYLILNKLTRRGLLVKHRIRNKPQWKKNTQENIEKLAHQLSTSLSDTQLSGNKKIRINDESEVVVHRGEKDIFELFSRLIDEHSGERMISIQGDKSGQSWDKIFSVNNINKINQKIKDQKMIREIISSPEWFLSQTKLFGIEWAKHFAGTSIRVQNMESKYLDTGAQIFVFKNSVYLVSMSDGVFIEIKNLQISKLLVLLTRFVQDHSQVMDANLLLRSIIEKKK